MAQVEGPFGKINIYAQCRQGCQVSKSLIAVVFFKGEKCSFEEVRIAALLAQGGAVGRAALISGGATGLHGLIGRARADFPESNPLRTLGVAGRITHRYIAHLQQHGQSQQHRSESEATGR